MFNLTVRSMPSMPSIDASGVRKAERFHVLNRMLVGSQAPPTPVDSHVTRWTQNDLTRGSYSYVKTFVSASNDAPQQILS